MKVLGWIVGTVFAVVLFLLLTAPKPQTIAEACKERFGAYGAAKVQECELIATTAQALKAKDREIEAMQDISRTAR